MRRFALSAVVLSLSAFVTVGGSAEAKKIAVDDYVAPVVGGIYGVGADGPGSYAVLIDVHEVGKDPARPGGGTANCSNDQQSSGGYALTGWAVSGPKTAHLTTSTVPSGLGSVTSALQASFSA